MDKNSHEEEENVMSVDSDTAKDHLLIELKGVKSEGTEPIFDVPDEKNTSNSDESNGENASNGDEPNGEVVDLEEEILQLTISVSKLTDFIQENPDQLTGLEFHLAYEAWLFFTSGIKILSDNPGLDFYEENIDFLNSYISFLECSVSEGFDGQHSNSFLDFAQKNYVDTNDLNFSLEEYRGSLEMDNEADTIINVSQQSLLLEGVQDKGTETENTDYLDEIGEYCPISAELEKVIEGAKAADKIWAEMAKPKFVMPEMELDFCDLFVESEPLNNLFWADIVDNDDLDEVGHNSIPTEPSITEKINESKGKGKLDDDSECMIVSKFEIGECSNSTGPHKLEESHEKIEEMPVAHIETTTEELNVIDQGAIMKMPVVYTGETTTEKPHFLDSSGDLHNSLVENEIDVSNSNETIEIFRGDDIDFVKKQIGSSSSDSDENNPFDTDIASKCDCHKLETVEKCMNYMKNKLSQPFNPNNLYCYLDNLVRCYNCVSGSCTGIESVERLAFCDYFYRYRHEILFKMFCLAINMPPDISDVPFSNFGIQSNRTPDLILERNGKIYVFEIGASSSFEKAAANKGVERMGFEGKYKKEINLLKEKWEDVIYFPFIFDMSNFDNKDYLQDIWSLDGIFKINTTFVNNLSQTVKELCLLTLKTRPYLAPVAHMLFVDDLNIKQNHSELDFMYNHNVEPNPTCHYKTMCVSLPVYNKINNMLFRLVDMVDKQVRKGDEKFVLIMNTGNGRVTVEKNNRGATLEEFEKNIGDGNKFFVFKMLKLKTGNKLVSCLDSETGVKFIERADTEEKKKVERIDLCFNHTETVFIDIGPSYDPLYYKNKIAKFKTINYNNNFYSKDYEDLLIEGMGKFDLDVNNWDTVVEYEPKLELNLLAESRMEKIDIDKRLEELAASQIDLNKECLGPPAVILKSKSPFLLPLAKFTSESYTKLNDKCEGFFETVLLLIKKSNPYTSLIIEKYLDVNYIPIDDKKQPSLNYREAVSKRNEISAKISRLQAIVYKKLGQIKLSKVEDPVISEEYKNLRKEIKAAVQLVNRLKLIEGIKNETNLIRVPTKRRKKRKERKDLLGKGSMNKNNAFSNSNSNYLSTLFEQEMQHFKNKTIQSTVEGVGYRKGLKEDFNNDSITFRNIMEEMMTYCGSNPDLFYSDKLSKDCSLLQEFKQQSVDDYLPLIKDATDSALGHACSFVSRLAHSLMYYSQSPFSSDYVRVENLGYKNVLLIVKGGKKIFKTKSSKLFRMVYPMFESTYDWYVTGKGLPGSTDIVFIKGRRYAITPWALMHESILNDAISFYARVMSFTVLNSIPDTPLKQQFNRIYFNVLLSFHNRRNTEVILANLRYILLATLGDFSGITQIFDEFSGFNYDCLQSYIRGCILFNYGKYFKCLNDLKINAKKHSVSFQEAKRLSLKNIFSLEVLQNEDELALMIYSSFLMTKGPYQRPVERANNLKGILKIHEYYNETVGVTPTLEDQFKKTSVKFVNDYRQYVQGLFCNDFSFDPLYCANLGCFMDSYFEEKGITEDFQGKWVDILNSSWDEMATSTGLRGDYNDIENFWGQKGYFVVYKRIVNDESYMQFVHNLLNSKSTHDEKRKFLRTLNVVFNEKMEEEKDQEFLIFHAVDKVQWRGGREIYVMDIHTKTYQQPIEKFMAYFCKNVDNELISIPSDRRAQVIHHAIFEKDLPMADTLTWYLTLDCTKWAPKSNFLKFVSMFLSMKCLPQTFKTHFMNYIVKLFKKRVYFNVPEVEVLKNNPKFTEKINEILIFDEKVNAYYIPMNYSWMMGIFNYTSSFLHAANQLYYSYILFKTSLKFYQEECSMVMFAHSDDSGGRVSAQSKNMIVRALTHYEIHLKACNHLLSKKKSVVSRYYFEILSVIYLFKKLLALLPKFLGGLRFLPTDKGPIQDMLQSYSKCIEVLVAGGSFSVAYLVMKFYSFLVYRFYYDRKKEIDIQFYRVPIQCFGLPDAHPLMVLICGSDSDILRLLFTEKESYLSSLMTFSNNLLSLTPTDSPFRSPKFSIQVRGLKKGFENALDCFEQFLNYWSIGNVNFHSTPFNLLSFLKKLNDPGFVGSLVNESQTRRISRAYFLRSGDSVVLPGMKAKLTEVRSLLFVYRDLIEGKLEAQSLLESILTRNGLTDAMAEIKNNEIISERQINVYKHILRTPLKVMKYFDKISLKGKNIVPAVRTLKPTHLIISKTTQVFSTQFDPSQIVSFIKEPELSWALPSSKGLITARGEIERLLSKLGFQSNDIFPELLLRLVRLYSLKSEKEIYLYSKVPAELRQIKTQTALLTFLAVNSFYNREVEGLVVNLSSLEGLSSLATLNVSEEIYIISNILSILSTMFKTVGVCNFVNTILNEIHEIGWRGGTQLELVNFIENEYLSTEEFKPLIIQFNFIKNEILSLGQIETVSFSVMKESFFHSYIKTQKSKSGWYGKGEILFYFSGRALLVSVYNTSIISVCSNFIGKMTPTETSYLMDNLIEMNLLIRPNDMTLAGRLKTKHCFGFDYAGDLCVNETKYMKSGYDAELKLNVVYFLNDICSYNLTQTGKDSFKLYTEMTIDDISRKIYCLKPKANYVLTLFQRLFNQESLSDILMNTGSNDFTDFLNTEIMPKYGTEVYIDSNSFIDGYIGSKTYEIIKKSIDRDWSKLPKDIKHSNLPAPEGSLTRILLDYSMNSGDEVISFTKSLTPEIMSLRSEFPEDMSIILSEQLTKNFYKMYSIAERNEIYEDYAKLADCESVNEMRNGIISLMKYWGYGSFVNTIEVYNLSQDEKNFEYFNTGLMVSKSGHIHLEVYKNLHNFLANTMIEYQHLYKGLDFPVKTLIEDSGVLGVLSNLERTICMSIEDYIVHFGCYDYYLLIFFNTLLGYLQDDDFCDTLNMKFKADKILSGLPINYKNRTNILVLYNTLLRLWYKKQSIEVGRDFCKKIDREAETKNSFLSMYKKLTNNNFNCNFKPATNYYGGFINEGIIAAIKDHTNIKMKDINYELDIQFEKVSSEKVPTVGILNLYNSLDEEVFDEEYWEEIYIECQAEEIDTETILELIPEEGFKFAETETSVVMENGRKTVNATIKWIIDPFKTGSSVRCWKYRQCGENLVILTNNIHKELFGGLPNHHCRILNFSNFCRKECPTMVAHVICNRELNMKFWDKYLGGRIFNFTDDIIDNTLVDLVRDSDRTIINYKKRDDMKSILALIEEAPEEKPQNVEEAILTNEQKMKQSVYNYLEECMESGKIGRSTYHRLKSKYGQQVDYQLQSMEQIMHNVFLEVQMAVMKNEFISGEIKDLTSSDNVKIFQAPEYWGAGHGISRRETKLYNDKKLKAELESLVGELAEGVANGTVKITSNMVKLCKSNLKIWSKLVKITNFKQENKKFLLTLFTTIVNSAVPLSDADDDLWQLFINKVTEYMADDGDEDDDDSWQSSFKISESTVNLKFKLKGT